MPRRAAGLTAAKVRTAKPGRYGDGGGLYLLVRSPEAKFWLFRYTLPGAKMRELGLGRAGGGPGAVTLVEARERAADLYRLVKAGVGPLVKREADAASAAAEAAAVQIRGKTFRDVAEMFLASHQAGWRNPKHRQQWRNTLDTYAHPHMGAVLDYAAAREWRRGENPARWRGHLAKLLPARGKVARVEHHPALPWTEVPSFMCVLRQRDAMAARALEFGILTAARTGEVLGMRWCEIDFEQAVWVVPAQRMKAGREHRVPLAPAAVAVLRGLLPPTAPSLDYSRRVPPQAQAVDFAELRRRRRFRGIFCNEILGSAISVELARVGTSRRIIRANHLIEARGAAALVFFGANEGRPLSNMAMLMLLRRMGRSDLTTHGFRSSFRDWTAEATNFPRELAEAALAHVNGDKTEAAYQRGDLLDKRRRMMEAWARFCCGLDGRGAAVAPAAVDHRWDAA